MTLTNFFAFDGIVFKQSPVWGKGLSCFSSSDAAVPPDQRRGRQITTACSAFAILNDVKVLTTFSNRAARATYRHVRCQRVRHLPGS